MKTTARILRQTLPLALLALIATAGARAQEAYGYIRLVDGLAELHAVDEAVPVASSDLVNQPLLDGDRLVVHSVSRVDAVLPDGGIVRTGPGSELVFDSLGGVTEGEAGLTDFTLHRGELQLVRPAAYGNGETWRVLLPNGEVFVHPDGVYRLSSDGYELSDLVVREGHAEISTARGTTAVRPGERAWIEGGDWPAVTLGPAPALSDLELWGEELEAAALEARLPSVEPELHYRAAPLAAHGDWVSVDARWAWRPRVAAGWQPYTSGRWVVTPAGLTWVATEPWGWIPSHYGSWRYRPGYGWIWFPGAVYSPAWVYWYWGPTHVAWVPVGHYGAHYGWGHGFGPRLGVFGWVGGSWSVFANWTFCPTRYFGRPGHWRHYRRGAEVARLSSFRTLPRGVLATDTRPVGRTRLGRPDEITRGLLDHARRAGQRQLPDVTDFVAGRRALPREVERAVAPVELRREPPVRVARRSPQPEPRSRRVLRPDTPDTRTIPRDRFEPRPPRGDGVRWSEPAPSARDRSAARRTAPRRTPDGRSAWMDLLSARRERALPSQRPPEVRDRTAMAPPARPSPRPEVTARQTERVTPGRAAPPAPRAAPAPPSRPERPTVRSSSGPAPARPSARTARRAPTRERAAPSPRSGGSRHSSSTARRRAPRRRPPD